MDGVARASFLLATVSVLILATPPALAAECKPLGLVASMDMTRLPSGRPGIGVMIANSPRTMLLDTGGGISAVTEKTVRELNLVETATGRGMVGVDGARTNMLARLPSIVIGGRLRQENALFYSLPGYIDPDARDEFDGILAGEWLKNYDADFDFARWKLNLFSPDHCAGKVVYWQATKVAVVPIRLDDGTHIKLRLELDGQRVDGILDTGAYTTTLTLTAARRLFRVDVNAPDVDKVGELTGGYSAAIYRKTFKSLNLEGVAVANPQIVLLPDMVSGNNPSFRTGSIVREDRNAPTMLLGMDVLRQLHVYIAYKERKLYITPASETAAPIP